MARSDEKDRPEAPSPRQNPELIGHGSAEHRFLDAFNSGRMHHAWLLTGPRGIGKATLAFRIARFVLAGGARQAKMVGESRDDLFVDPSSPVFRRVAAGGHADLLTIERGVGQRGNLRSEIVVDDVRRVGDFLHLTSSEGGWRAVVVDSADELNRSAANALLKILEEPPDNSLIILVSHNPGRLLPTIRSRCRTLALRALELEDLSRVVSLFEPERPSQEVEALALLARGSAGFALELAHNQGLQLQSDLSGLVESLPRINVTAVHALSDRLAPAAAEARYMLFREIMLRWLAGVIRAAATGEGPATAEGRLASRAPLDRWLEVWEKIGRLFERADAVNLDRKQVLVAVFMALRQTTRPA